MDLATLNHKPQHQGFYPPTLPTSIHPTHFLRPVNQPTATANTNESNTLQYSPSLNEPIRGLAPALHALVSRSRPNRSVIHVKENSIDELDALFDPSKWSQRKTNALPLIKRNLPQSFFRPPESGGTRTPKRPGCSTLHSRQGSVDQTNVHNSSALLNQQHVLLQQRLASLNPTSLHSRSASEPVCVMPPLARQQGHFSFNGPNSQQLASQISMPYGWQSATTQNGQQYFVNYITQETSWTLPTSHEIPVSSPLTTLSQNSILGNVSLSIFDKKKTQDFYANSSSASSPLQTHAQTKADLGHSRPSLEATSNRYLQHSQSLGSSTVASLIDSVSEDDLLTDLKHPVEFHSQEEFEFVLSQIAMPEGWQRAQTDKGEVYFINHITKNTYWEDPRINLIPEFLKKQQQQHKAHNATYPISHKYPVSTNPAYQPADTNSSSSVSPFSDHLQNENSSSFSSSFSGSSSSINEPVSLSSALAALPIADLNNLLNPVEPGQDEIKRQILQVIGQKQELFRFLEELNKQEAFLRSQLTGALESESEQAGLDLSGESFESVLAVNCSGRNEDVEQMNSLYDKMLIDKSSGDKNSRGAGKPVIDDANTSSNNINNTIVEEALKVLPVDASTIF